MVSLDDDEEEFKEYKKKEKDSINKFYKEMGIENYQKGGLIYGWMDYDWHKN